MHRFQVLHSARNSRPDFNGSSKKDVSRNMYNCCKNQSLVHSQPALPLQSACGTVLTCENLKICGTVYQTDIQTSQYELRHVMNTYYVTVENCTNCALKGAWLNIVLRSLACSSEKGLCLFGKASCSLPTHVKFLLPSACDAKGELTVHEQCEITGQGYSVQIPILPIGRTILTIVVTIDVPPGTCALPCTLLPAQVNLRFVKWHCGCPVVCFQTSALIGCQLQSICCDPIDDAAEDDVDDASESEKCHNESESEIESECSECDEKSDSESEISCA